MSKLLALYTSDPFLAACEAARTRPLVSLDADAASAGMGGYDDGIVLLRRWGPGQPAEGLWAPPESDAVVLHTEKLPVGVSLEDNAQPFKFRTWLFAHAGQVHRADEVRERLMSTLPDFLNRATKGTRVSEAIFAAFLAGLRSVGRIEDLGLEAPLAAQLLARAANTVEQVAKEVGVKERPELNLVATNGRVMVAAHRGPRPLWYTMLEGEAQCARCGIPRGAPDSEPLVREHRRRRSLVIASDPLNSAGWLELPDGGALAVDRRLQVQAIG
jgi:predicted glutamine amidotransferase